MADAQVENKTPFGPGRVSYHAVTRYMQRIRRVSVAEAFQDPENEASAHCDAAGTTIAEIRSLIWTPFVAFAVERGFQTIGTSAFIAIASISGTIVTICEPRRRERRKLKLLSDKELAAKAFRVSRRRRTHFDQLHPNED